VRARLAMPEDRCDSGRYLEAIESIQQTGAVIAEINDLSNTIASAVEEPTATATEMSRNVAEAAKRTAEIAKNITSWPRPPKIPVTAPSTTNRRPVNWDGALQMQPCAD
jgi:hypothetical protein